MDGWMDGRNGWMQGESPSGQGEKFPKVAMCPIPLFNYLEAATVWSFLVYTYSPRASRVKRHAGAGETPVICRKGKYMNVRQGAISCTFGDPPPITGRLDIVRPVTAGTVASAQEAGPPSSTARFNQTLRFIPIHNQTKKNFSPDLQHTGAGLAVASKWSREKRIKKRKQNSIAYLRFLVTWHNLINMVCAFYDLQIGPEILPPFKRKLHTTSPPLLHQPSPRVGDRDTRFEGFGKIAPLFARAEEWHSLVDRCSDTVCSILKPMLTDISKVTFGYPLVLRGETR
ncbi:uncharacterized protein BO96DRAFT_469579 [Aspergillus niger CBS 101883]|uniref:uncharacterized protein n=1 Tax=Aspergillus lacticoffeatus (strain CBS 101883) TaxID=1450533 RepID=UPI000D803570|nr:uncharacterized protein BO96DRAFT_469579 [Aspergillus niger CBS 101883]PYH51918.1 hypothetical protein BO96DRAFT_469579 [Aspergillus niger CBS 101883]